MGTPAALPEPVPGALADALAGTASDEPSLFFVGNATVLLRCCGLTVLTDPNFLHAGQRAYLGKGMFSKRLRDPAIGVEDLPDLDAVVLSHVHGDHWDRVTRRGLDRGVSIITTVHAARRLRRQGFAGAVGVGTWGSHQVARGTATLTVTSLPGRHAPGLAQALLPPVMGSLLEFAQDGQVRLRLYQSGDTLVFDGIREMPRRFPDIDVGVLHLGGTRVPPGWRRGLLVTMDARQGADLLEVVRPGLAVPVHHDDYTAFTSPVEDFTAEVARRLPDQAVAVVARGRSLVLPLRDPGGR